MKNSLCITCSLLVFAAACGQREAVTEPTVPGAVDVGDRAQMAALAPPADWLATVQQRIMQSEYEIREQDNGFATSNRGQRLVARWDQGELALRPLGVADGDAVRVAFNGLGRAVAGVGEPAAAQWLGDCRADGALNVDGQCLRRLHVQRGAVLEWWENREQGLEQGFTLLAPPERPGRAADDGAPVTLELAIRGARVEVEDGAQSARLLGDRGWTLRYGGLAAWDAAGAPLEAWLEGGGERLAIRVLDGTARYPVTIDPLISTTPLIIKYDLTSAQFGFSVASAGDVNNDGYDDVIVGAPYFTFMETNEGKVFVYHGSASGLNTLPSWNAELSLEYAYFGFSVASAGDVDCDGFDDIIVGGPGNRLLAGNVGRVYVFHGSASGISLRNWYKEFPGLEFGYSVASAGNIDGAGCDDVVIGMPAWEQDTPCCSANAGQFRVYRGYSGSGLETGTVFGFDEGFMTDGRLGHAVAPAGDVDGDGYDDIIVGEPGACTMQPNDCGRAHIYFGQSGPFGPVLFGFDQEPWVYESPTGYARLGSAVAGAGDVNRDGYADVIIGAPEWPDYSVPNDSEGRVLLFYGSAAHPGTGWDWIYRIAEDNARLGAAVASAGDVNNDGYGDVIVGAPSDLSLSSIRGRALLFLGSSTGLPASPNWSMRCNVAGVCDQELDMFGASVGAGDFDGDGYSDLVIGAPGIHYSATVTRSGAVFVFGSAVRCNVDDDCDNGQYCDGVERCVNYTCVAGTAVDCSGQADQCNDGVCNDDTNQCEQQPKAGNPVCSDNNPCTDGDRCNASGVCVPGPNICVDAGPSTDASLPDTAPPHDASLPDTAPPHDAAQPPPDSGVAHDAALPDTAPPHDAAQPPPDSGVAHDAALPDTAPPHDAAPPPQDSGPGQDAAQPPQDAGVRPDTAQPPDATGDGFVPGQDSGSGVDSGAAADAGGNGSAAVVGSGCTCRASDARSGQTGLLIAWFALALIARRRAARKAN
ncbi:MAG: FG-GAP repeat protein [Deltaproteobacteria bacterium]|nr:FG-GAP repeat protein [Deltaproteobacteria bacterium]